MSSELSELIAMLERIRKELRWSIISADREAVYRAHELVQDALIKAQIVQAHMRKSR